MPTNMDHARRGSARSYHSELQPLRQSLMAALAKVDFELESDVETVRNSSVDEWLKQTTIRKLQERHRERRAPYVQRLASLQRQTQALAA